MVAEKSQAIRTAVFVVCEKSQAIRKVAFSVVEWLLRSLRQYAQLCLCFFERSNDIRIFSLSGRSELRSECDRNAIRDAIGQSSHPGKICDRLDAKNRTLSAIGLCDQRSTRPARDIGCDCTMRSIAEKGEGA